MTAHYHAGHNDSGYLPESDVLCFDTPEDALQYLASELDNAWPDSAFAEALVEAEHGRTSDTWSDALHNATHGGYALPIDDGRALPHVWWVAPAKGSRDNCELAQDQAK